MTVEVTLDEFEDETSSGESSSLALEDRLLSPISPSVGLRLIPGHGDPLTLQKRGTERYLFRDDHDRWFIPNPRRRIQKRRSSAGCISRQTSPNGWRGQLYVDGR